MTPRQHECLEFLRGWFVSHEFGPSLDEISAALELNSKSQASRLLSLLARDGHVVVARGRARGVRLAEAGPAVRAAARRLLDNVIEEDLETGVARVRVADLGDLDIALAESGGPEHG